MPFPEDEAQIPQDGACESNVGPDFLPLTPLNEKLDRALAGLKASGTAGVWVSPAQQQFEDRNRELLSTVREQAQQLKAQAQSIKLT